MTSSAHLQREADAARVELADTLLQLRDGLSTSAISSEAIALAKGSSLSLARTLVDQARTNPVPALLIGAGLTMLLTRTTGGDVMEVARTTLRKAAATGTEAARGAAATVGATASRTASQAAAVVSEAATRAASFAAETTRETATAVGERVAGKVGGTVDQAQQQVNEGYATMKETLESQVQEGQRRLEEGKESAARLASAAQEKAASLAHQAQHSLSQLLHEQPILVAAIGAALGAAIGAALPISRTEKDMIGAAGARAVGMGREAVEEAAQALRQGAAGEKPMDTPRTDMGHAA